MKRVFFALVFTLGFLFVAFSASAEYFLEEPNPYRGWTIGTGGKPRTPAAFLDLNGTTYVVHSFQQLLIFGRLQGEKRYLAFPYNGGPFLFSKSGNNLELFWYFEGALEYAVYNPTTDSVKRSVINELGVKKALSILKNGNILYVFSYAGIRKVSGGLTERDAIVLYIYDLDSSKLVGVKRIYLSQSKYFLQVFSASVRGGNIYFTFLVKRYSNPEGARLVFGAVDGNGDVLFLERVDDTDNDDSHIYLDGQDRWTLQLALDENGRPAILCNHYNYLKYRVIYTKTESGWEAEEHDGDEGDILGSTAKASLLWMNGAWHMLYISQNGYVALSKKTDSGWQDLGGTSAKATDFSWGMAGDTLYVFCKGEDQVDVEAWNSNNSFQSVQGFNPFLGGGEIYFYRSSDGKTHGVILNILDPPDGDVLVYEIHPSGEDALVIEEVGRASRYQRNNRSLFERINAQFVSTPSGDYIVVIQGRPGCGSPSVGAIDIFKRGENGWELKWSDSDVTPDKGFGAITNENSFVYYMDGKLHILVNSCTKEYIPPQGVSCPPWTRNSMGKCYYQAISDFTYDDTNGLSTDPNEIFKNRQIYRFSATDGYLFVYASIGSDSGSQKKAEVFKTSDLSQPDLVVDNVGGMSGFGRVALYSSGGRAILSFGFSGGGIFVAVKDGANSQWRTWRKNEVVCDDGTFSCGESDCSDGVDNDGDGLVDEKEFSGSCSDGNDNDNDGEIDEGNSLINMGVPYDAYFFGNMAVVDTSDAQMFFLPPGENRWYYFIKNYNVPIYFTSDNWCIRYGYEFMRVTNNHGPRVMAVPLNLDLGGVKVGEGFRTTDCYLKGFCVTPFRYLGSGKRPQNFKCRVPMASFFGQNGGSGLSVTVNEGSYQSVGFEVSFTPDSQGKKVLSGTVTTNDPENTNLPFSYTGVGIVPGDINMDGIISVMDALLIARHILGLHPPFDIGTDSSLFNANCDWRVNTMDAVVTSEMSLGIDGGWCR